MGSGGEAARRLAAKAAREALEAVERRLAATGTPPAPPPAAAAPPPPGGFWAEPPAASPDGPAAARPPAVPPPAAVPPPSGAGATRAELARQVGDLVAAGRELAADRLAEAYGAVAARKDPARKHARRIRRTERTVTAQTTVAGGLAVLAATAGVAPGWTVAEVGFGGAAAVVAIVATGTARRLRELRRMPPPPPRLRPARRPAPPPRDSPARGPMDRLAERERVLAGLLAHLGSAGAEPAAVAADAAATLRQLGARTAAVDAARRGAPAESVAGLDAAVAVLVEQLETGVAAYGALVAAAADAVAASATLQAGDPVLLARLDEATDSLAGLAAGLREVA